MSKKIIVYFSHCRYLYDLMYNFSIFRHVNWTDNGLKITLCQYYKIGQFQDVYKAIQILSKWDGNEVTKQIGRSVIRAGDIFKCQDAFYLFVCKRLVKIPQTIANRLILK